MRAKNQECLFAFEIGFKNVLTNCLIIHFKSKCNKNILKTISFLLNRYQNSVEGMTLVNN